MGHLTEIKPSAYVVNLSEFEESEVAKSKKKSTPAKRAGQTPEAQKVPAVPAADEKQIKRSKESQKAPPKPAVEDKQIDQAPAPPQEPAAPEAHDKAVTIKQTKVSYDEDTRLYTIESKGEFYDDSRDLERVVQIVRELVPSVAEKELNALRDL
jgi:hypothetical protein